MAICEALVSSSGALCECIVWVVLLLHGRTFDATHLQTLAAVLVPGSTVCLTETLLVPGTAGSANAVGFTL